MNRLNKFLTALCLVVITSTAFAMEDSTILLSNMNNNGKLNIDFLNENNVSAMQFDISIKNTKSKQISLKSCVKNVQKSHNATCSLKKNGDIRVVLFSTSNAVIDSGSIGFIDLGNANFNNISIENIVMGNALAKKVTGSYVIDISKEMLLKDKNKVIK